jgi:hypothetical protein
LQRAIWPTGEFLDYEQGVNKAINRLREVLRDDPRKPHFIETIPKRGYRFIAEVECVCEEDITLPVPSIQPSGIEVDQSASSAKQMQRSDEVVMPEGRQLAPSHLETAPVSASFEDPAEGVPSWCRHALWFLLACLVASAGLSAGVTFWSRAGVRQLSTIESEWLRFKHQVRALSSLQRASDWTS